MQWLRSLPLLVVACSIGGPSACAADPAAARIDLGDLILTAPDGWTRKPPASKIVAHEFAIPAAEGDKLPGRMTVTAAGGSVDANLERWYGQFAQHDGSNTADRAKLEKVEVAGFETHLVDISGTFHDRPSPREPAVNRQQYRMLGAILVTGRGTFYVKFYGPEKIVAAQEKAFRRMVTEAKKP